MGHAHLVMPFVKEIQDKVLYLRAFRFSLAREMKGFDLGTAEGEQKLEDTLSFKVVGRTIAEILDNYFNVCFYMLEPFKRTDRLKEILRHIQRAGHMDQFRGMSGMTEARTKLVFKELDEMAKEIDRLEVATGRLEQFLKVHGVDQARWGASQSENAFHGWVESLVESYHSLINVVFPWDTNFARRTHYLNIVKEAARVTLQTLQKPAPGPKTNPGVF